LAGEPNSILLLYSADTILIGVGCWLQCQSEHYYSRWRCSLYGCLDYWSMPWRSFGACIF